MAGFVVDYGPGKLVFANGYTWPNPCLRFDENATTDLWVREFVGEDREVIDGTVPMGRSEKARTAHLGGELTWRASSTGTAASTLAARQQQWKTNLAELATVAAASLTGDGVQTVTYTPWVGATPKSVDMVVSPPILGDVIGGVGYRVGLVVVLVDGGLT